MDLDIPKLSPDTILRNGINIFLVFIGILAAVMIILSAVQLITSSGNPEKVKKAKMNLMWGIIGLAIALMAGTIVNLVMSII